MKQLDVRSCIPEQSYGVIWPCWCPAPGQALLGHISAEGEVDQCKHSWLSVWTSQSVPWSPDANLTTVCVFQSGCCEGWVQGVTLSSAYCEMESVVWLDTDLMGGRHEMNLFQQRIG